MSGYTHPKLGRFLEEKINFADYLVGAGKWMNQSVIFEVMGSPTPRCLVRDDSMWVLEYLLDNELELDGEIKRAILKKCQRTHEVSDFDALTGIKLRSIRTDDDLNFEFSFEKSEVFGDREVYVYGSPDLGVEGALVQD